MTLIPSHDIEALVKRLQDRCVTLSQKNRELEQALAEARGKALEEAAKAVESCPILAYPMVVSKPVGGVEAMRATIAAAIRALNTHP